MNLIDETQKLHTEQLAHWPLARQNHMALNRIMTRTIDVNGFTFTIQCNPARANSSGAKVDARSISARPCFLCHANRPAEQTSVTVGEFDILVNPFPIFPKHFTIAAKTHQRQSISGQWCQIAALAWQMPGYTVFYNGPECGASAPDHFHFQAIESSFLPLWKALSSICSGKPLVADSLPYGAVLISSSDFSEISRTADTVMSLLPPSATGHEPKVNVLCRATGDTIMSVIIPRRAHRPRFYPEMMISPASVDLSGVFITPVISDFGNLTDSILRDTIADVCYTHDEVRQMLSAIL